VWLREALVRGRRAARTSRGLYHRMSSSAYLAGAASVSDADPHQRQRRERDRLLRQARARALMGNAAGALELFYAAARPRTNLATQLLLPDRADNEAEFAPRMCSLLVFCEAVKPTLASRRASRRGIAALAAAGAGGGADNDEDEDGAGDDADQLGQLLEAAGMDMYTEAFKREGLRTIRAAKSLSHTDLRDSFGVESFAHRERLIDAFQSFGKTAQTSLQGLAPKRDSLRLQTLLRQADAQIALLKKLGLERLELPLNVQLQHVGGGPPLLLPRCSAVAGRVPGGAAEFLRRRTARCSR
jgi:hypothetical protein